VTVEDAYTSAPEYVKTAVRVLLHLVPPEEANMDHLLEALADLMKLTVKTHRTCAGHPLQFPRKNP
jgi:hypothetical protein